MGKIHLKIVSMVNTYVYYILEINFDMRGDQSKRAWCMGNHSMAGGKAPDNLELTYLGKEHLADVWG